MKCEECRYKEPIEESDSLLCIITNEEHDPADNCNCDLDRLKRERREAEARLRVDRAKAESDLAKLRDSFSKARPDTEYIYKVLYEIRSEVESAKLEELIQYLEAFV